MLYICVDVCLFIHRELRALYIFQCLGEVSSVLHLNESSALLFHPLISASVCLCITHSLKKNESRHSVFITISQWPVGCVWVNQSFLAKTIYRTSMSVAVGSISLSFSLLSLPPIFFSRFPSCLHNLYSFPPSSLCIQALSLCTGYVFVTFILHNWLRLLQSRRLVYRVAHMFWHSYILGVGFVRINEKS